MGAVFRKQFLCQRGLFLIKILKKSEEILKKSDKATDSDCVQANHEYDLFVSRVIILMITVLEEKL